MSNLDEYFQAYWNRTKNNLGEYEEKKYQKALKEVVDNLSSGGGGDIYANAVKTNNNSNVQTELDLANGRVDDLGLRVSDNETAIEDVIPRVTANEADIGNTNIRIDNLNTTNIALLRGGTVRDLSKVMQRYSSLTVFFTFTGSSLLAVDTTTNIFDLGFTTTESPLVEGLGEVYEGQTAIEWVGIYSQDTVGGTTISGTMLDTTNKVFKMPDAELQTGGLWKTYMLDVSIRVIGTFGGIANNNDEVIFGISDKDTFSTSLAFLKPAKSTLQLTQQSLISRLNKTTSKLIQNGLEIKITPKGSDFTVTKIELMVRASH